MLGSAIIVFREVLEAALIVGLIMAVTRDIPGRKRFVTIGIASGLAGAFLLALFGDFIAPLAEGMGSELLNAGILFVAVIMLSWHLVWMKKHSVELSHNIKQMGARIESGEEEASVIAIIIGLAILREGSEAVLFMFGLSAAGSTASSLLLGALVGVVAGIAVGTVVYLGLARVPLAKLFRYSGGLILLLTAGLAAQASLYLVQADILPALGNELWDTSAILSDQSLFGQFLHIIIGYVAQPMGIQVLVYFSTIIIISVLMYLVSNPLFRRDQHPGVTAVFVFMSGCFFVGNSEPVQASHKIYSPYVEQGEVELEMRTHTTFDSVASKNSQDKTKLEAGYGVTEKWFTAIGGEIKDNAAGRPEYQATFWENIFQLTEQGEHWVDVGAYVEYKKAHKAGEFDELEGKLLLEKNVGRYVNTANLVVVRNMGSNAPSEINFEYAWRTKYLMSDNFEPGIEIYGEMGELGNFAAYKQQDHRIGPVFSGEFKTSGTGKWKYELGYLFGISDAAPDGTLKFNIEYEFRM